MKNLFFCFTPYHVKVANKIAESCKDDKNDLITFANSRVDNFIDYSVFNSKESFFMEDIENIKIKSYLTHWSLIDKAYEEMCSFEKYVEKVNPDRIFTFSDNPIYFQKIFKNTKAKIILVEEGTGMYAKEKKYNKLEILGFYISKWLIFRVPSARLFTHGKGGYEDYVLLREPQLIENKSEKIKITKEFFKSIFEDVNEIDIEEGYLYSPAGTLYDKEKMLSVTKELFEKFYNGKKVLYVKLHPREVYEEEIKKLASSYKDFVKIIDDKTITSEDIVLNKNIKGLVSDFSSMLVNASYLREDLDLYTTLDLIEKKHGVNLYLDYTILDYLRENGTIKDISELVF